MAEHIVKILQTEYVTHDVKRIVVEKPTGYTFIPGQGTDVSVNKDGFRDQRDPFTFTSLNEWDHLEFTIKIYRERNAATKEIEKLKVGDELIIREPWGAIQYKGPGVFLAGGSGITPFMAILRQLAAMKQLEGNMLIFSVQTSEDVIYGQELVTMLGDKLLIVLTREGVIGFRDRRIDEGFLKAAVRNFSQNFYVCGPEEFVTDITGILATLGANSDNIVIEK